MKKVYFWVLGIFLFLMCGNAYAANSVSSISMDIYIDDMGTAHVTEIWDAYLDQGTEGYKPYYNLGNSVIKNFKVYDGSTLYTNIGSWDTNASFSSKANKNGIHYLSNGVELCFGISSYGSHKYRMEYEITNFVLGLEDADMVYWTLMPYDFSVAPNSVYIKIYADEAFSDDLDVWGYGNYGGYAYVYDGYIEMSTNGTLDSDEYMTILIKFPQGTFNTDYNKANKNFSEYLEMAEEGAEHYSDSSDSFFGKIVGIFIFLFNFLFQFIIWFVVIFAVIKSSKNAGMKSGKFILDYGETGKKLPNDVNMFRDIPCNKDIYRAYWVAYNYNLMKKQTDFLGVILLKWLKEKQIRIESKTVGALFKKEETTIVFNTAIPNLSNELENNLYKYMYEASKDGILESKEFEKWCSNNYSKILNWFDKVLDYENEKLVNEGKLVKTERVDFKIFKTTVYKVDPSMMEEAIQMKGLKEFFNEFENMQDKEAIEVMFWEEYLMYAQIFGVADKVAKQFKKLYPDVITDYSYDSVIFVHTISYTGMHSASSAKSRAESYSSGGGGFSSGGGGGGSFGGGGGGGGFR